MAAVDDARFDAVIIGAGFSGLYMLYELRRQGWRTIVLEMADAVGGTWLVNRYPGARCDIESIEVLVQLLRRDPTGLGVDGDDAGMATFDGASLYTSRWPAGGFDFTGTRVGVIGTGSTGVQMIPVVAREAAHLTVCQRSTAYRLPWQVHAFEPGELDELKANYGEIRAAQHVGWIARCLNHLRANGNRIIEALASAQTEWIEHATALVAPTVLVHPSCNSWYNGGNVPGKKRMYMGYTAGIPEYRRRCDEIAANGYVGFRLG